MQKNKRLVYVDCLRGVAMWMVVYSHIVSFSMGHIQPSPLGRFFSAVMLPLFFFISGFCAYKENLTVASLGRQLLGKTRAILIPTVVMFLLFMLYSDSNPLEVVTRYDKGGYWFTWVLFQIMLIYLVFCTIASGVKQEWARWIVMASPLLLFSAFSHIVGFTSQTAVTLELVKVYGYYVYFLLGLLVRRFDSQITAVLSKTWANALLFVVAAVSYIEIGGGYLLDYQCGSNILLIPADGGLFV
jgi:surface polysaccharide O-acyltransferase-like enzyme